MSSTIFQGLQSCLEPRLIEHRPLCLKLVSPTRKCISNDTDPQDFGTFSSIKSLTNTPQESSNYIHPLLKRPSSSLSKKSLEMCTENLGCETGTDIIEINSSTSSSPPTEERRRRIRAKPSIQASVQKRNKAFPPPLTSIAGGSRIHVMPHREDGRLVLKAITTPSSGAYFQAERSEGRLCLRLLNTKEEEKENEDEDEKLGEEEEKSGMDNLERSRNVEGVNGNESNGGGEIGIGKIQRLRRCSEGGQGKMGMMIWEHFCVASS